MKTVFNYSFLIGLLFFLGSCGGSSETKVEEKVKETVTKKVTEEVIKSSIDTKESNVHWKGEMLGVYSHEGLLNFTKGMITVENGKLAEGSFSVDMSTMKAIDKNYNEKEGKTPEKLIGHLSSPDFFDVTNHPSADFVITNVKGNEVVGKLTLKGVSSEETVKNITLNQSGDMIKMTGDLTFDRQKYGVSYSAGKDAVLSDDIELKITLITEI